MGKSKNKSNIWKVFVAMGITLSILTTGIMSSASASNDYLTRSVTWSGNTCTGKTKPYWLGTDLYAVATVFVYNNTGTVLGSDSSASTVKNTTATASVSKLSTDHAKVYHYVTTGSGGTGTSYGYVSEELKKGTNL